MKIDPRRLDEVERRYLRGEATRDIERECAAEFKVTRRQVQTYISIVRKRIAASVAGTSPEEQRARIEGLLLRAYRVAEQGGEKGPNPNAMVAAAHRLGELHGVLAPKKIEHSGAVDLTDPQALHDRLATLAAKATGEADADAAVDTDPGRAR